MAGTATPNLTPNMPNWQQFLPQGASVAPPTQTSPNALNPMVGGNTYGGGTGFNPQIETALANNYGGLLNTQQQGLNQYANANLAGMYGLAGTGLTGANQAALQGPALAEDITKTGMQTGAEITKAQIGAFPNLINSAIAYDRYRTIAPYQTAILQQLSPLIGSLTGYITGGNLPNFNGGAPNIAGGTMGLPQAGGGNVNVPMSAPKSVISPSQANAMLAQNAGQGNASTQSAANQFATGNQALDQQLAGQLAAQNSAALNQSTTNFAAALQPANAQQGLGAAQLDELVRNNMLSQMIQGGQVGLDRFKGLTGFLGNVLGGAYATGTGG